MREAQRPTEVVRNRQLRPGQTVWDHRKGAWLRVDSVTPTAGRVDGTPGLVEMIDVALGGTPAQPVRAAAKTVRLVPALQLPAVGGETLLDLLDAEPPQE